MSNRGPDARIVRVSPLTTLLLLAKFTEHTQSPLRLVGILTHIRLCLRCCVRHGRADPTSYSA